MNTTKISSVLVFRFSACDLSVSVRGEKHLSSTIYRNSICIVFPFLPPHLPVLLSLLIYPYPCKFVTKYNAIKENWEKRKKMFRLVLITSITIFHSSRVIFIVLRGVIKKASYNGFWFSLFFIACKKSISLSLISFVSFYHFIEILWEKEGTLSVIFIVFTISTSFVFFSVFFSPAITFVFFFFLTERRIGLSDRICLVFELEFSIRTLCTIVRNIRCLTKVPLSPRLLHPRILCMSAYITVI